MVPKKKKVSRDSVAQPIRILQIKRERERDTELENRINRERDIKHFNFILFISV